MARPQEFNPKEALNTAINLFWEKGYHDTSVDEVVKRSGVAKYGIYGTFGPKRDLFKKALHQFAKDRQNDIQRPLRKPDASLPEVHTFFREAPKIMTEKNQQWGCLMCNTGIELGFRDPEIQKLVKEFFHELASVMKSCLDRAIAKGEIQNSKDTASLATYLVTEFRTSLMLARSGHSRRDIEGHLKTALQVL